METKKVIEMAIEMAKKSGIAVIVIAPDGTAPAETDRPELDEHLEESIRERIKCDEALFETISGKPKEDNSPTRETVRTVSVQVGALPIETKKGRYAFSPKEMREIRRRVRSWLKNFASRYPEERSFPSMQMVHNFFKCQSILDGKSEDAINTRNTYFREKRKFNASKQPIFFK